MRNSVANEPNLEVKEIILRALNSSTGKKTKEVYSYLLNFQWIDIGSYTGYGSKRSDWISEWYFKRSDWRWEWDYRNKVIRFQERFESKSPTICFRKSKICPKWYIQFTDSFLQRQRYLIH